MDLLETIGPWQSSMMEPLEARLMLSSVPALDQDIPFVRDAGGGRVVIAASAADLSGIVLLRLRSDGSLDPTFGQDGVVRIKGPGVLNQLIVLDDAKMLVLANDLLTPELYRLNADGSVDQTFGVNGRLELPEQSWFEDGTAAAVQRDGRILVAEMSPIISPEGSASSAHLVLARYTPDGRPDTTFGDDGTVITAMPRYAGSITSLNVLAGGEIWVSAWTAETGGLFARYDADGSLDQSFGDGGVADYSLGGSLEWSTLPDGRIFTYPQYAAPLFVSQYRLEDGQLNSSFGDGGSAKLYLASHPALLSPIIESSGRVIVGLQSSGYLADIGGLELAALRSDGSLDTTFASNGLLALPDDLQEEGIIMGLAAGPDGGLIEAHIEIPLDDPNAYLPNHLVVNRFDANGNPISTFGAGGRIVLDLGDTEPTQLPGDPEPSDNDATGDTLQTEDQSSPPSSSPLVFAAGQPFAPISFGVDGDGLVLFGSTPENSLLGRPAEDIFAA